ncbi:hypothetical protein MWH25_01320 [Natroniella acetigena]|uniref:hypothetical protein n=1 Tax=Natroniella acetigena TaxID=52004 RepID=UPI00200B4D00|nr:hypothetical protein [Natroniella acetigena]MCK8826387.1 hypothetical protein [Natroniella acetigena]
MWECKRCNWSGDVLKKFKIEKIGYYKSYRGCPSCKAGLGQGVEPKYQPRRG